MTISLNLVVCTNTEVASDLGRLCDDATDTLLRSLVSGLGNLPFVADVAEDKWFPNWNGGKFAHQAKMYGNHNFGRLVVCIGATRTEVIDNDPDFGEDTEDTRIEWKDLTDAEKTELEAAIDRVIDAANAAADKVQEEEEARNAEYAAEREKETDAN